MATATNAGEFTQKAKDDAGRGLREEGTTIIWPGSFLFKFVERADIPDKISMLSPWWFQESAVRRVLLKARDHRSNAGITLNSAACVQAREDAGLSKTWDGAGANYILVGKVISPVKVIWGTPQPVGVQNAAHGGTSGLQDGSDVESIEIIPNPQCVQFYVAGMRDPLMARKCIAPKGKFKFSHSEELASGMVEEFLTKIKGGG
jgi:hypothetical protein